jgi:hypothetical protein
LPTQGAALSWYTGLAGVRPVLTTLPFGPAPLDVVHAGGDAFDLVDLANDPQVLAGAVDLSQVRYVRLTDIDTGTVLDDFGTAIWDRHRYPASADDAVIGVNNNSNGTGPVAGGFRRPAAGSSRCASRSRRLKDVGQGLDAAIDTTPCPLPRAVALRADAGGPLSASPWSRGRCRPACPGRAARGHGRQGRLAGGYAAPAPGLDCERRGASPSAPPRHRGVHGATTGRWPPSCRS